MKSCIFFMFLTMVVSTTICSCHLVDAYPVPPPQNPDTSGNYLIPPTGGSDTSHGSYAYVRVSVYVDSGSAHFTNPANSQAILTALSLKSKSGSAAFVLGGANSQTGNNNATVSLVHAENAQITPIPGGLSGWRAIFPQYSATDTLNQPYVKAVVINTAMKKIYDYRAYLLGTGATLDYLSGSSSGTINITSFISAFNASNVPVITVQP